MCFVLEFALPPFSPPLPSVVENKTGTEPLTQGLSSPLYTAEQKMTAGRRELHRDVSEWLSSRRANYSLERRASEPEERYARPCRRICLMLALSLIRLITD